MCLMSPDKFSKIQAFLDLNRIQMARLLCCSESTIASYKSECEVKRRNIPALKQKVLLDEYIKAGGDPKDLEIDG